LLDKVVVTIDGTDHDFIRAADVDSRASYEKTISTEVHVLSHVGSDWKLTNGDEAATVASTAQYPTKAGWGTFTGSAPWTSVSVAFKSERIDDDGHLKALSLAEEHALTNPANSNANQFENGFLKEQTHYAQGAIEGMSAAELAQLDRWIGAYD